MATVERNYQEIVELADTLAKETERVLGHEHEVTVMALGALFNLKRAKQESDYGLVLRAVFVLGRLEETAKTLAGSRTKKISDDDKRYMQCWPHVARELLENLEAAMKKAHPAA